MVLKAARRVHLQTTLTPVRLAGRPDGGKLRRPTTERAAELRQLALTPIEVREVVQHVSDGARAIAHSITSTDPLALNRVLAGCDESLDREVLQNGARLRVARI
jgi:hypothetical protein